jgi:hypothetical protein
MLKKTDDNTIKLGGAREKDGKLNLKKKIG